MSNRVDSRYHARILIMIRLLRDCLLSINILEMLVLYMLVFCFCFLNCGMCLFFVVFVPVPSLNPQTCPPKLLVSGNSRYHMLQNV